MDENIDYCCEICTTVYIDVYNRYKSLLQSFVSSLHNMLTIVLHF